MVDRVFDISPALFSDGSIDTVSSNIELIYSGTTMSYFGFLFSRSLCLNWIMLD